uniref:Claudin 2 n=1 Tax=Hippocampus comes TaxID=109280 RepID=A0A3Q2XRV0_HIPCM
MASAGLELVGFFLGLLGLLGSLVSTALPFWENTAHVGSNIVTASGSVKGLWMECVHQSTGAFQCETYNSILALSSDLQASRALMVVSLVLSTLGLAIAVLGMQCTVCLEGSGELKKRVAGVGGCFFLAAGFMTLVPVSWTTNKVIQNFYSPSVPATLKFELGDCLYLGPSSDWLSPPCRESCDGADAERPNVWAASTPWGDLLRRSLYRESIGSVGVAPCRLSWLFSSGRGRKDICMWSKNVCSLSLFTNACS